MKVDNLHLVFMHRRARKNELGLAPVVLRLTIEAQRAELATGLFCPIGYWRNGLQKLVLPADEKQRVLPDYGELAVSEYNEELYQFQRDVIELYKRLRKPDPRGPVVEVRLSELKEALRGPKKSKDQRERERAGNSLLTLYEAFIAERGGLVGVEISTATDLSHKTRYNRLTEFLQAHGAAGMRPEAFTLNQADKLLHWLLKERGMKRSTANKILGGVAQVLGWGVRREIIAKNPLEHYEYKHQAATPIKFLTTGELNIISSVELPNNTLGLIRDCFVFQCWTGLAYADLKALNVPRDAEYHTDKAGNLRRVLRITRAKSTLYKGYECVIPLLPEAERLLAHYEDELPVLCNQYYNRGLKELGQLCSIKAEKMTTHVGRKTAGTLFLNMGAPLPVVSKILGHANVLITQRLYAELLDTTVIDAFAMLGGYAPAEPVETISYEVEPPLRIQPAALRPARLFTQKGGLAL
jgi:site-specific recombinase XerD